LEAGVVKEKDGLAHAVPPPFTAREVKKYVVFEIKPDTGCPKNPGCWPRGTLFDQAEAVVPPLDGP
jgi:hypothetical protein